MKAASTVFNVISIVIDIIFGSLLAGIFMLCVREEDMKG